ncbi:MAG: 3'(2'),5'-bisphosphate nucleotidase CysQ [Marinilabiliaceae bacterium]|nr:3'(2'),5'-bisphosphate nucleotidase CysQ [Marinilabiliaceae bacterium]
MINILQDELAYSAIIAAITAGKEVLKIYDKGDTEIWIKDDKSPLTEADLKSNKVIVEVLDHLQIPILSEESKQEDYKIRKNWSKLWLVDPLDGTKEFIKRNGEFTVNIALIENNKVAFGVIFVPVKGEIYVGKIGEGAYKAKLYVNWNNIDDIDLLGLKWSLLSDKCSKSTISLVVSKSHFSDETRKYVNLTELKFGETEALSAGSSLKLCLVADGNAHAYPRFGPTMEWDTAAGQAIVVAMGGQVLQYPEMEELTYNRENLRNPWFICVDGGSYSEALIQIAKEI